MTGTVTLNSLLSQCQQSLHTGILSLRQLAPVHQALCQCSSGGSTGPIDCQSIQPSNSVASVIQLQCSNEQDQATCQQILKDGTDAKKLLVIQYLMFRLTFVDGLRCVLIAYLIEEELNLSEDLIIALLDLVEGEVEETQDWAGILTSLQTASPMAVKILVCLLHTSPSSPTLIQAFHDKLWQTLQEAMSSTSHSEDYQNHPVISSLSKELLPVLTHISDYGTISTPVLWTELHRAHTLILWKRLFSLVSKNQERQGLLVITTVLCPLMPHLKSCELPLVDDGQEDIFHRPLEQPALWNVIFTCLSQGKSFLQDGEALSSILRKRSLYLLNTIAEESNTWKKYVICVETLEMESEQHLVDQIWDAVADLLEAAKEEEPNEPSYGVLTLDWMSLLFSRVLSSEPPAIRKLGMYRLLKVQDGSGMFSKQKRKGKKRTRKVESGSQTHNPSMLACMPPDFILHVLLPSWDSLCTSVGFTMHLEQNRKQENMIPLLTNLLQSYLDRLNSTDAEVFWKGLWSWTLLARLHTKTIVLVFQSLTQRQSSNGIEIPADNDSLQSLFSSVHSMFHMGSMVLTYRKELLQCLSVMLAHCIQPARTNKKWTPMTVLQLLTLFSANHFPLDSEDWSIDGEDVLVSVKVWISRLEQDASALGAALAAAFVSGELGQTDDTWDPISGASRTERELSWAVSLLCSLATDGTAGTLLWPAINKGLSSTAGAILTSNNAKADRVTRALLLLENGCRLRQLSGLGNGDLVVDKKTQQLMPPPPNIETMLSSSVDFILYHIRTLLSVQIQSGTAVGTRSNGAKRISATYARLIAQLRTLQQSYPSSNVVPGALEELLKSSFKTLSEGARNDNELVMLAALIYAAVSSGADQGPESHIPLCRLLLKMELSGDPTQISKAWEQTARSILQYAKWAAIASVLPMLLKTLPDASAPKSKEAQQLIEDLLDDAFDAVEATPADALLPLFNCILAAGEHWVSTVKSTTGHGDQFYIKNLAKIIEALVALMVDSNVSQESMYMLNETCALIFQPKLLVEEYNRLVYDPDCLTPIRDAFRKLIGMAGDKRPHITRSVLCRITVGWLGEDGNLKSSLGLSAIPYRDDVVKLLLHKESKIEEASTNQSQGGDASGAMEIPEVTNNLSVTRAFMLVFLSKLPDPNDGVNEKVLEELLHHVILGVLDEVKPISLTHHSLIMKGTPLYCLKMRGWQALCIISRFVTIDIASTVCDKVFMSMPEAVHPQIRFFIEIFTIKCALMHPVTFGNAFLGQISRRDLSLQHISSLMIMGGNWVVGKYKLDFFEPNAENEFRLKQVLASVIPWLSSTQGFSRAIAQLLVHALVPLVVEVDDIRDSLSDNDWFLRVIYTFLNENKEMARLRKKQSTFFQKFDVEIMCTVEGVLSVPVDEGDEANPVNLVDAMKATLKESYEEAHGEDAPVWKQVEEMLESQEGAEEMEDVRENENVLVNFQRKIIPLDALNLAMEDLREKRLRNATGERKQQLIVCASLVDKVPNLAGLARTAEIFAADRLVVPDITVTKMDNFKSISVGAGEWIDIDQVREEDLLAWLLDYKAKGYFVFGLEQTSSSMSLTEMVFPDRPTILLLGKEKEGIPVEFLQAVDQCVEIPQMGMIRSLNVHVSGAIAIWEHTKQRRLKST